MPLRFSSHPAAAAEFSLLLVKCRAMIMAVGERSKELAGSAAPLLALRIVGTVSLPSIVWSVVNSSRLWCVRE